MALKNLLDWIITDKLKIKPKTSLPTVDLEDGQLDIKQGVLCIYDETRGLWLSVQRQTITFGRPDQTSNQYLNYSVGTLPSSVSGFRMMRNACVTGISVQTSDVDSYNIHIRANDVESNIVSLTVTGAFGASDDTINTNLTISDYLQCYLEYTGSGLGCEDPVVMIELAWRL